MINTKFYALFTSVILTLIAILHLSRMVAGCDVVIGGWVAPQWLSVIGAAVPGWLAIEGMRIFRQTAR